MVDLPTETKLATLNNVREHTQRDPVELWLSRGRLVVRAYNECGNNSTDIDLIDLLDWTRSSAGAELIGEHPARET
jgi:hypothetical protein